jgi:response regulator RpfG family c-di-GMP phosphodiesterase
MTRFSPEILAPVVAETSSADDSPIGETEAILIAVAQAVEQRDPQTARHCERLAFISVALGLALHLDRTSLIALYRGGFLHDVGKIGIPDSILFKPTHLTAEEWVVMRSHTQRGEEICRHIKAFRPVLPIIRHHHERWNGTGYPDGLRGKQIPLLARVLQIADIYDALTSPRPYKRPCSVKQALRVIAKETARGWRDPQIVSLFFELHGTVISRIDELSLNHESRFEAIRGALASLDGALSPNRFNGRDFPDFSANGRTSFPLPQSAPLCDFPGAAAGRWRTE